MTKAKPFLQHSTSCTIWLGPKAMGGGFNDRADVQRTCRGMLGDGLKKHSSSLWPGKAAQGQLCGGAVGGGGGVGGWLVWESQTHVYNKRQVTRAKLCILEIQEWTVKCVFPCSFSQKDILHLVSHYLMSSLMVLTCLAINNNVFPQTHGVDSIGTSPKYRDMEIQSSWQICTAASEGCRDE